MKTIQILALGFLTLFTMCTAVTSVGVAFNPIAKFDSPAITQQPTDILVAVQISVTSVPATLTATPPTATPTRAQEKPATSTPEKAASVGNAPSQAARKQRPNQNFADTGDFLEILPAPTATPTLIPTPTETVAQLLKSRIVFYLIVPEHGRTDACGNPTLIPIISKRYRTGDKLRDVQLGLQMLFDLGVKYYGPYYNALWDTRMTINSVEYRKKEDYAIIDFGGFLPVMQMSKCDKHGARNQIWKTFFHYEFREKTFTINGAFLIDQLNR